MMKKASTIMLASLMVASIFFSIQLFGESADTQVKTKTLNCWRCHKSFTVPIDRISGSCPYCQAKYVLPPPAETEEKQEQEAAGGAITWQEAMKKMGKKVTVEAEIVNVYDPEKRGKKGPVKLNVDRDWKGSLTFVLFNRDSKFGDPTQFLNKKVRVTGVVGEYRGSTQIKVESPSNIKIIN